MIIDFILIILNLCVFMYFDWLSGVFIFKLWGILLLFILIDVIFVVDFFLNLRFVCVFFILVMVLKCRNFELGFVFIEWLLLSGYYGYDDLVLG